MVRFVVSKARIAAAVAAALLTNFVLDNTAIAAPKKPAASNRKVTLAAFPAPTGLAASHTMQIEGGRMCFADHFHYGSSDSMPNVKMAQAAAIESWASFVDFEYGNTWANFAKSASREFRCKQSTSGVSCDLSARPCR